MFFEGPSVYHITLCARLLQYFSGMFPQNSMYSYVFGVQYVYVYMSLCIPHRKFQQLRKTACHQLCDDVFFI